MGWILALAGTLTNTAFLYPLLRRVGAAVGLTLVTYTGVLVLFEAGKSAMIAEYGSAGADILTFLSLGKIDRALSVVLSAFAVKIAMIGLDQSGALKRVLLRPNQQGALF